MNAFEFTLLTCFVQKGLVTNVKQSHHTLQIDDGSNAMVEGVIQARHEAASTVGNHVQIEGERVLAFEGHVSPVVVPKGFVKTAEENPGLVAGKLSRYFTAAEKEAPRKGSAQRTSFQYRFLEGSRSEVKGMVAVTMLLKDHFSDSYELVPLLVSKDSIAGAVLLYLDEMTDGRMQPVAVFPGIIKGFLNGGGERAPAVRRKKDQTQVNPQQMVIEVILDEALKRAGHLDQQVQEPFAGTTWLAELFNARVVVAVETDIPFAERQLATAVARRGMELLVKIAEPLSATEQILTVQETTSPSLIVLSLGAYPSLSDPEGVAASIVGVEHAALISCSSVRNLPEPLKRIVELVIPLPKMDHPMLEKLFKSLFGVGLPGGLAEDETAWIRYVQPSDLARVARLEQNPMRAYVVLKQRIEDRLMRLTPKHGPSLSELHGLGEARIRAEMLIADIQAAMSEAIPWSQVDRGMLLTGPPGCGKTTLARAIAKDCAIQFVECSAARWQMAGYLNDHLAAIARDFQEARRFEPTIMFIDEIDSIGSREKFIGSNAVYQTQVVNAVLAELQGFSDKGKVFVIAATNNPENVDPALRRAGRLDRVIEVTLPTIDALEKIFDFYLGKNGIRPGDNSDIALKPLAEATFGRTGADVSLAVRGAVRRARLAGRPMCQEDLLSELFNRPLDNTFIRPLSGEGLRRVALHEAGHAVLRIKHGGPEGGIAYISIIPRPDGSLGFVSLKPNPDVATVNRSDYLAYLMILLGGRAAEEVFYGADQVGAGAGGSEKSDLAKATGVATDMVCKQGLGKWMRPNWRSTPTNEDLAEIEELIGEAYDGARKEIAEARELVERVADALVKKQEMSGEELRKLVGDGLVTARHILNIEQSIQR